LPYSRLKNFEYRLKIPDIRTFQNLGPNKSPIQKLSIWVCEQMGKRPKEMLADLDPKAILIHPKNESYFWRAFMLWATETKEMGRAHAERAYRLEMEEKGPQVATLFPEWLEPGYIYVDRKNLFIKKQA
jgi:hypothetical protein